MSKQGGPGNEGKGPESEIPITQSANADRIMAVCFVMATQKLLKLATHPETINADSPGAHGRLEFLLKEILGEVKNMPAQGATEADEAAAKRTAITLIEQIGGAIRRDISAN